MRRALPARREPRRLLQPAGRAERAVPQLRVHAQPRHPAGVHYAQVLVGRGPGARLPPVAPRDGHRVHVRAAHAGQPGGRGRDCGGQRHPGPGQRRDALPPRADQPGQPPAAGRDLGPAPLGKPPEHAPAAQVCPAGGRPAQRARAGPEPGPDLRHVRGLQRPHDPEGGHRVRPGLRRGGGAQRARRRHPGPAGAGVRGRRAEPHARQRVRELAVRQRARRRRAAAGPDDAGQHGPARGLLPAHVPAVQGPRAAGRVRGQDRQRGRAQAGAGLLPGAVLADPGDRVPGHAAGGGPGHERAQHAAGARDAPAVRVAGPVRVLLPVPAPPVRALRGHPDVRPGFRPVAPAVLLGRHQLPGAVRAQRAAGPHRPAHVRDDRAAGRDPRDADLRAAHAPLQDQAGTARPNARAPGQRAARDRGLLRRAAGPARAAGPDAAGGCVCVLVWCVLSRLTLLWPAHRDRLPDGAGRVRDQRAPVPHRPALHGLPARVPGPGARLPGQLAAARGGAGTVFNLFLLFSGR